MSERMNPLLDDDPETTALRIRNLLSLVELACSEEIDRRTEHSTVRMYGCELAVQIANEAIQWPGEINYRRKAGQDNACQLGGGGWGS